MTAHAIQRARERLGVEVTQRELDEAMALCGADPRAVLVERQRGGHERWIAPLKGVLAGLVICADRGKPRRIVTIMHPSAFTLSQRYLGDHAKARRAQKRRGTWAKRGSRLVKLHRRQEA